MARVADTSLPLNASTACACTRPCTVRGRMGAHQMSRTDETRNDRVITAYYRAMHVVQRAPGMTRAEALAVVGATAAVAEAGLRHAIRDGWVRVGDDNRLYPREISRAASLGP